MARLAPAECGDIRCDAWGHAHDGHCIFEGRRFHSLECPAPSGAGGCTCDQSLPDIEPDEEEYP